MNAEPTLEQLIHASLPFEASVGAIRVARDETPASEIAKLPAKWSEKRAREHFAGRRAALRALERLGCSGGVGRDEDGVPLFPPGTNGSIAHTGGRSVVGLCVATSEPRRIGVDIEKRQSLEPELIERIIDAEEAVTLGTLGPDLGSSALWAFCGKEAYYKCVFPAHRRFLGFHEVSLTWDEVGAVYHKLRASEKAAGDALEGRVILTDEFVVAVVWGR